MSDGDNDGGTKKDLRLIEALGPNGEWLQVRMLTIRRGMVFRATESTGEPVKDNEGSRVFFALSDVSMTKGVAGTDTTPVTPAMVAKDEGTLPPAEESGG